MQLSDEAVASTIDAFHEAALGAVSWLKALEGLARLVGGNAGQLIGFGSEAAIGFNWTTLPPEAVADFDLASGHDLAVNSRVRIGRRAPELTVLDERHFSTAEDMRRHPEYGEVIRRYDIPQICLTPLLRDEDSLIGLSVMRSARQGEFTSGEARAFAAIAPQVRAAVRAQLAIEHQGAALLVGALEQVSAAVFACDPTGRVQVLTPAAERLVREGRWFTLRGGLLSSPDAHAAAAIRQAAAACAARLTPAPIVVRDGAGARILAEVAPAPRGPGMRLGVAALFIVRLPDEQVERRAGAARALFGLTRTEALIAARLAAGQSPQAIASASGVGVGTVRTHIRRIFEKSGFSSQVQLVATLAQY